MATMATIGKDGSPTTQGECKESYHPNKMVYFDGNDARREIHVPTRDYYKSHLHLLKKEWSELARFPKWDNQSYTEADNVNNITDANQFYSVTPEAFEEWLATEDKAVSADAGTNRDEGK